MIYFTGDTHRQIGRFSSEFMSGENTWTNDDVIIVCGDFGYIFFDSIYEKNYLNELEKKPYTIAFVDGNHENFPVLYSYPSEEWNGGIIHRIRKNIVHLTRGQVFTIQGKKIFTFGGAFSTDRDMRILGDTYWEEEIPTQKEFEEGIKNLLKVDMKVDYVVTHTIPGTLIETVMRSKVPYDERFLAGYLDRIMGEVKFTKWFFGHWHEDKIIHGKFYALLNNVEKA